MDISRVKLNLGRNVIYNGIPYKLTGCIIRADKSGLFFYQAEIQDLKAPWSIAICRLQDLSEIKEVKQCKK